MSISVKKLELFNMNAETEPKQGFILVPKMCIEILQYSVLILDGLDNDFHHVRAVTVAMLRVIHYGEQIHTYRCQITVYYSKIWTILKD